MQGKHGGGEQRGIGGARLADGQRADRNADSAFDSTGTPKTGSGVMAAVMPGRCAAPPAPAMITL